MGDSFCGVLLGVLWLFVVVFFCDVLLGDWFLLFGGVPCGVLYSVSFLVS